MNYLAGSSVSGGGKWMGNGASPEGEGAGVS